MSVSHETPPGIGGGEVKSEVRENFDTGDIKIMTTVKFEEFMSSSSDWNIAKQAIRLVAQTIADDIIAHKLPEIMEKISADAIANMAIAEAGAAVNNTLKKEFAEKVQEIEKPVIYQKGLFGGLKKIS